VCGKSSELYTRFKYFVEQTIGSIVYEIIYIDNNLLNLSICQAYNLGGQKARYDILLFVHEDVEFITQNWGNILIQNFDSTNYSLLGLAGSTVKTRTISSWWQPTYKDVEPKRVNHIERKGKNDVKTNINPLNETISEVITIDGVFMAVTKTVWNTTKFNSFLSGFHIYDLEYSLQVSKIGKVGVLFNIDILHLSMGRPNKQYYENQLIVHKEYSHYLPIATKNISRSQLFLVEKTALINFIKSSTKVKLELHKVILYS
jgi:hypothetical protein